MPKVGMRLRLRLAGQLPLNLIPDFSPLSLKSGLQSWVRPDEGNVALNGADVSGITPKFGSFSAASPGGQQPLYNATDSNWSNKACRVRDRFNNSSPIIYKRR